MSAQLSLAALLPLLVLKDCPSWERIPPESEQGNIMLSLVKTWPESLSGSWSSEFLLSLVAFFLLRSQPGHVCVLFFSLFVDLFLLLQQQCECQLAITIFGVI